MELNFEPAANDTISLHPEVLARHEQQLVHLQNALSKDIDAGDSDAAEAIRELVETVTVFRDASRPGGITVEIADRLNALRGNMPIPATDVVAGNAGADRTWIP
jgi:site-specific DNA recombinase